MQKSLFIQAEFGNQVIRDAEMQIQMTGRRVVQNEQ